MEGDSLKEHLRLDKRNLEAHMECYLLHNGLIDILGNRK